MSSGLPSLGGKSLSASASSFIPSQPISVPSSSFEPSARRPAAPNPSVTGAARKGQAGRKQHRDKRRPLRDLRADGDDDAMAEIRALRNASSRRGQTSITHLLNYSIPTRQYIDQSHAYAHGRAYRRHATWGPGSGHHPIDKAKFVHANYRFIVSPTGDYSVPAYDADQHLEWIDILQILASTESQATSCPICLSDPVAPRMAKCGHIFCLPCLIRFMNSTNEDEPSTRREARWKKCPICEDSFKLAEVKPVRFYAGQESPLPSPGDDVVLRLMVRESGSTLALPREGGTDVVNLGEEVPWHFAANVLDYARIMKGTPHYLAGQYENEIAALRLQAEEDEHQFGVDDGDWTIKAVRSITTARDKLREDSGSDDGVATPLPEKLPVTPSRPQSGSNFHFYTAPPHLYLSPLDIRILKTKFGDFSNFPSTLLPRVEHISTGHVVDDALRKRAKYLAHLPHGCVISFLECDWTDIVSADILDAFAEEIDRRRKSREDKAAQEERERLQSERLEAAAMGRGVRRQFDLSNDVHLDDELTVNVDDFQPLAPAPGSTPPNPRPGFEPLADISTSPSTVRTVWGTRAIAASPDLNPVPDRTSNDGWLKDDAFLGAAEKALQMEALSIEGSSAQSNLPNRSSGGKKKKKQKITLMSTGGHRGG